MDLLPCEILVKIFSGFPHFFLDELRRVCSTFKYAVDIIANSYVLPKEHSYVFHPGTNKILVQKFQGSTYFQYRVKHFHFLYRWYKKFQELRVLYPPFSTFETACHSVSQCDCEYYFNHQIIRPHFGYADHPQFVFMCVHLNVCFLYNKLFNSSEDADDDCDFRVKMNETILSDWDAYFLTSQEYFEIRSKLQLVPKDEKEVING